MTIHNFDIKKARITEYLTLSQKRYLVSKGVESVLDTIDGIFICDGFSKDVFLTMILFGTYFGCDLTEHRVEAETITTFNEEEYEIIHEKDLVGVIERTKHCKDSENDNVTDLARRVRRALDDFALFTKLFNTAVNNELIVRNDIADRLAEKIALQLSPETWQQALAELQKSSEAMQNISATE